MNTKNNNKSTKHIISESSNFSGLPGILRMAFAVVIAIIEVIIFYLLSSYIRNASLILSILAFIFDILVLLHIINTIQSPAIRTSWIIISLVLPFIGCTLYLLWGNVNIDRKEKGFASRAFQNARKHIEFDENLQQKAKDEFPALSKLINYTENRSFPIYENTKTEYYPLGDDWWPALINDLESAEKFIFMEFFIVNSGEIWDSIMEVLCRKAKDGVEVRFMYDDFGSLLTFPKRATKELLDCGAQVQAFNKVNRYISSLYLNYRNHQKIAIIDGNIAHIGGTNLADEYANLYVRYGHWKDTCMRLEGDAVWGFTTIFLSMWDLSANDLTTNYDDYRPTISTSDRGYYIPMADGPANNPTNPIMDVYKLMISEARDYCYITTPYLVLDDDMIDRLKLAARSGTDVRLILPKIPDHWYVNIVTHSFYSLLIKAGVKIYEYSPGYIHAKMAVSDDSSAILGSVNLDFRSFFYHYEDMVWMFDSPMVNAIKQDVLDTIDVSEEVDYELWGNRPLHRRMLESAFRVIAPML